MLRLSIENDRVVCTGPDHMRIPIDSVVHLFEILAAFCGKWGLDPDDLTVMSSSSINWPQEYTNRKETIDLCYALNQAAAPK